VIKPRDLKEDRFMIRQAKKAGLVRDGIKSVAEMLKGWGLCSGEIPISARSRPSTIA
jgi:hypothetical protein